jgi:uncharacterized membrane protein (Fun14 family)
MWRLGCNRICINEQKSVLEDLVLDCHYGPHFDTGALDMPQNSRCIGNITSIQQNLRHTNQFNLLRIGHTFLTPAAHGWAKSKIIRILISHIGNFLMASMLIWLHSCKKQNGLINITVEVYSDAQSI